ncbi:MAG: CDP-archaeol synthase [Candidatus Poseidoniales archaeon]|nr:MAG: CDP-archaeol synthase [Candidatus Poseidoniales archaeon]
MNSFARHSSDRVHSPPASGCAMDVLSPFPSGDPAISALNILSVLMMYGPFYLANTGAMLFGKWIPEKLGFSSITIDGGRNWKDGFRLLGDGKTWNGLLGGAVFSGLLTMFAHYLWLGGLSPDARPFVDPTLLSGPDDWFWVGGEWGAAFTMGFTLGLACMIGDTTGSFIKRRRGLKREGDESSKAPLLDTVPFAIAIFVAAFALFDGQIITHDELQSEIVALLVLTPIIHRLSNQLGYRLGLKSVPF